MTGADTPSEKIDELRRNLRAAESRETALRDVIQTIARSGFNLEFVLQTVIDRAVELCEADVGNIARRDGDADVYRIVAFTNLPSEYERLVRELVYTPERGSVIGRTVLERRVVRIPDVLNDPDYTLIDAQQAGGYRSLIGVPMLREGVPVGVIVLGRNNFRPFSDSEIWLIEAFADQVVIAIENVRLYETVERQRTELSRFAPQVADLLTSNEGARLLAGHRREITALFCDLRGFTAFAETAEPEEVLGVLRDYHSMVGELVIRHGGTLEHFAGDGLMAFFNDPTPVEEHALEAVRTAVVIVERFGELANAWRRRGHDLGLGIGISTGFATLGRIGFEGRYDYGAVGTVVILASRLSDAASPGEILLSLRTQAAVEADVETEPIQELELKGFSRPMGAARVI